MRIGLMGGSFDPAHAGHLHVANVALRRLTLDKIWWLPTPQNPLKPQSSPLKKRVESARAFARGAHMVVTDLESRLGVSYTYETLRALKRLYPGVHFVFVMGEDNLINFRRWRHWREVAAAVPFAVIARPHSKLSARMRLPKGWRYFNARHHPQSSADIRAGKRT